MAQRAKGVTDIPGHLLRDSFFKSLPAPDKALSKIFKADNLFHPGHPLIFSANRVQGPCVSLIFSFNFPCSKLTPSPSPRSKFKAILPWGNYLGVEVTCSIKTGMVQPLLGYLCVRGGTGHWNVSREQGGVLSSLPTIGSHPFWAQNQPLFQYSHSHSPSDFIFSYTCEVNSKQNKTKQKAFFLGERERRNGHSE